MFINKKQQDFILSNGKSYSDLSMMTFDFVYFKLDYKR